MAKFNPDVPQPGDPNYLSYSRGVEPDKSSAFALSGVGNLFEASMKGGAKLIESNISEELRDRIHPLRDQHEAGIESTLDAVRGVKGKTAQDIARKGLLPSEEETPPVQLDSLRRRVGSLEGARANGKVSETYYLGSLNQIAKEFRARYPGFREYVDKEIKEITGRDSANAYISSMISDINSYAVGPDRELNAITTFMKQNIEIADPHTKETMAEVMQKRISNKVDDQYVYNFVHRNTVTNYHHRQFEQRIKGTQLARGEAGNLAYEDSAIETLRIATNKFNNLTVDVFGTSQKISDVASDALLGRKQYSGAQWQIVGEAVQRGRAQAEAEVNDFLNTPVRGPDNRMTSRRALMGADKTKEIMTGALAQWNLVEEAILKKDGGLAYHQATQVARIEADEHVGLLNHKTLSGAARLSLAVGKNPEFQKTIVENHIANKGSTVLKNYVDEVTQRVGTQHGATPSKPNTLKGAIDKLNNTVETNPRLPNSPAVEKARNDILSIPLLIPDPVIEDQVKRDLIIAAFHPDNKGILDDIIRDHTKDGKPVSGRFMAFKRMASKDIGREVIRLDALYPAEGLAQKYTDWTEATFRSLVNKELADFDSIIANPNHKVTWDDKNQRFSVEYNKPKLTTGQTAGFGGDILTGQDRETFAAARASINRLNLALDPMKSVAEVSGRNVEAYLLDTLVANRDLRKLEKLEGNLPQFMIDAIAMSKKGKEKQEKAKKAWEQ